MLGLPRKRKCKCANSWRPLAIFSTFSVQVEAQKMLCLPWFWSRPDTRKQLEPRKDNRHSESEVRQEEAKDLKILNRVLNRIINHNFKTQNVFLSPMLVFNSPYYWTLQTRISPSQSTFIFFFCFSSHRMLNSWPCQQHNSPNTILVSRPPPVPAFLLPGKILPRPWTLCLEVLLCHPLISIVVLL